MPNEPTPVPLGEASLKHTPGPWEIAFYSEYGVNDGSIPDWTPPRSIAAGQCAACANPNGVLVREYKDEKGHTIHVHRFPSDDWHSVYAADGTPITGNYDYEMGGVCSSEADARLIAAAPDLLDACRAFVTAYEKSLQLEKTDVALRFAKDAIAKAEGRL